MGHSSENWTKDEIKIKTRNFYHHNADAMRLEKCHNGWMHHYFLCCELFFFCWYKNCDIFMAAMAMGRLADRRHFLGIVHDLNKNKFHEKKKRLVFTYKWYCVACCQQLQRKDNQCLARYRWHLLSVYHDIATCSQQKLKNFLFFISLVDNHTSLYF